MRGAVRAALAALFTMAGAVSAEIEAPLAERFRITEGTSFADTEAIWSAGKRAPFLSAMARFPTVESCADPDAVTFAFVGPRLWSEEEIKVCLFLLAESLGTSDAMEGWFAEQDLQPVHVRRTWRDPDTKAGTVHASLTVRASDYPYNTAISLLIAGVVFDEALIISVSYDETGRPYTASLSVSYL